MAACSQPGAVCAPREQHISLGRRLPQQQPQMLRCSKRLRQALRERHIAPGCVSDCFNGAQMLRCCLLLSWEAAQQPQRFCTSLAARRRTYCSDTKTCEKRELGVCLVQARKVRTVDGAFRGPMNPPAFMSECCTCTAGPGMCAATPIGLAALPYKLGSTVRGRGHAHIFLARGVLRLRTRAVAAKTAAEEQQAQEFTSLPFAIQLDAAASILIRDVIRWPHTGGCSHEPLRRAHVANVAT